MNRTSSTYDVVTGRAALSRSSSKEAMPAESVPYGADEERSTF
ncbi:hypothetical protein [Salibacterium salarium]|nr:hypothetical protein [Salibacterium salarium]